MARYGEAQSGGVGSGLARRGAVRSCGIWPGTGIRFGELMSLRSGKTEVWRGVIRQAVERLGVAAFGPVRQGLARRGMDSSSFLLIPPV